MASLTLLCGIKFPFQNRIWHLASYYENHYQWNKYVLLFHVFKGTFPLYNAGWRTFHRVDVIKLWSPIWPQVSAKGLTNFEWFSLYCVKAFCRNLDVIISPHPLIPAYYVKWSLKEHNIYIFTNCESETLLNERSSNLTCTSKLGWWIYNGILVQEV